MDASLAHYVLSLLSSHCVDFIAILLPSARSLNTLLCNECAIAMDVNFGFDRGDATVDVAMCQLSRTKKDHLLARSSSIC